MRALDRLRAWWQRINEPRCLICHQPQPGATCEPCARMFASLATRETDRVIEDVRLNRNGARERMRAALLAVFALAFLWSNAAQAQDAPDVEYDFYGWARYATGPAPSAVRAGGGVYVTGPIAVGSDKAAGQLGVGLAIESLPDKGAFSFADLGSWGNYFEVTGHAAYRFGTKDLASGRINTYAIAWGGATFDSFGQQPLGAPELRRALRHYAGGLQFEHRTTEGRRSWVCVGWGTDDAVGPVRFRQLLLQGSVHVKGPVYLDGRAGIAFGAASAAGDQPDYFIGGLRVSGADLVGGGK